MKYAKKRGISRSYNYSFINEQERLEALNLEYRKDFYAEGQYFHFLKLHEMSTYLNCPIASGMTARQYVFRCPTQKRNTDGPTACLIQIMEMRANNKILSRHILEKSIPLHLYKNKKQITI